MRRMMIVFLFAAALAVLAACGSDQDDNPDRPVSTSTPTAASPAATLSPVLVSLQRDYEQLQQSHREIAAVWNGIDQGVNVSCAETTLTLPVGPEAIDVQAAGEYEQAARLLRDAAIRLDDARALWVQECSLTRTVIPPDVIRDGVSATRDAGRLLDEAQAFLATIQGGDG